MHCLELWVFNFFSGGQSNRQAADIRQIHIVVAGESGLMMFEAINTSVDFLLVS